LVPTIKDNSGTGWTATMEWRTCPAANRRLSAFACSSGRMVSATGRTVW